MDISGKKQGIKSLEDFSKYGFTVMKQSAEVTEQMRDIGIDLMCSVVGHGKVYLSYRYKKSGLFSWPGLVQ